MDRYRMIIDRICKGSSGMDCKSNRRWIKLFRIHYWGVIDNWSWANAFKNRYGFIRVALDQGYKRIEKKSANWIREVAKNNEFE